MDAPGTLWFSGAELSTNLYVILVKRTFIWTKKKILIERLRSREKLD